MDLAELVAARLTAPIDPELVFPSVYDDVIESILFTNEKFNLPESFEPIGTAYRRLVEMEYCRVTSWSIVTQYMSRDEETLPEHIRKELCRIFGGVDVWQLRRAFFKYLQG